MIGIAAGAVFGVVGAFWGPIVKERFERRQRAAAVRDRYSPPLLQAAFDLQSRLYNIVRLEFLDAYLGDDDTRGGHARNSTLWLLAQFLGWVEILRREAQFLDFGRTGTNRALQEALGRVASELASDAHGEVFAVFRAEQRAIGEIMIEGTEGGEFSRRVTLGYAAFVSQLDQPEFKPWFDRLAADIDVLGPEDGYSRLIGVQRALIGLIDLLDPERVRYPNVDTRGKLPLLPSLDEPIQLDPRARVARFVARASEYGESEETFPLGALGTWGKRTGLSINSRNTGWTTYAEPRSRYRWRLVVDVRHSDDRIEIYASVEPPRWPWASGGPADLVPLADSAPLLRRRRRLSKAAVNDLLLSLGRPPML